MCLYEVTLKVKTQIADEFKDWLKMHVEEMLNLEYFTNAEVYQAENPDDENIEFVCTYRAASREALESYFSIHAAGMRADGLERFGGAFSASRRILRPL